ncbi:unnamed protein product [Pleuronectes platessa]|uniref:Uncharacterized protein n=1 Tax=Pleuronectes platessa TaxID=8262 RepID=A0A9N7TXB4_PLEPL|nr:unnamed protein product [Pleuronectes platessa]
MGVKPPPAVIMVLHRPADGPTPFVYIPTFMAPCAISILESEVVPSAATPLPNLQPAGDHLLGKRLQKQLPSPSPGVHTYQRFGSKPSSRARAVESRLPVARCRSRTVRDVTRASAAR